MEKIALVTDSTSDLDNETIEKYDIKVLRLKVIYKDREYIDGLTIESQEVYENLEKEIPTTSTPSIGDADALFKQLTEEGYTHVLCIHISSGLSGTLNMIRLALEKYKQLTAFVFDSKALSLGAGALVIGCAEMIKSGMSFDDVISQLPSMRDQISVFFVVDTLKYLIKGGRIGKVAGVLGSIMSVKPIISIGKDGVYYTYEKVRGKAKALGKMIDIIEEKVQDAKAKVWLMHGDAKQEAKEIFEKIKALKNVASLNMGLVGPVLGVHTGPGLVGVVIVKEPFFAVK